MTLHHLKLAVASRAILSYMAGAIWKCLPCIMVTPSNATAPFQFLILAKAVGKRVFLFWTVGPDNGRQFISGFFDYQLSMSHKIAVQSKNCTLHTVISKDDFSKLTVEKAKSFQGHCNFDSFFIAWWQSYPTKLVPATVNWAEKHSETAVAKSLSQSSTVTAKSRRSWFQKWIETLH